MPRHGETSRKCPPYGDAPSIATPPDTRSRAGTASVSPIGRQRLFVLVQDAHGGIENGGVVQSDDAAVGTLFNMYTDT